MLEAFNSLDKAVFNSDTRIAEESPEPVRKYVDEFWNNKETLYRAALAEQQRVVEQGLNWRNFGVGAAALAINTETGETAIITGYNSKETPEAQKHCAEKRLFTEATSQGFNKLAGLVVVAEYQSDDISKVECTTLHPCDECRKLLANSTLAYPELPIVTMSVPPSTADIQGAYSLLEEQHTLAELITKHQSE